MPLGDLTVNDSHRTADRSPAPPTEGAGKEAGVPPVLFEKISRRHLPHWRRQGATYFLTWRCAPGTYLSDAERDAVLAALRHWDGVRCTVYAAVVMPDHVHALVHPLGEGDGSRDLTELIHGVKSYSAHRINRLRGRGGRVWQDERYDRWVRHEDEFAEKWQYIADNPVKAGLVDESGMYLWLYLLAQRPE